MIRLRGVTKSFRGRLHVEVEAQRAGHELGAQGDGGEARGRLDGALHEGPHHEPGGPAAERLVGQGPDRGEEPGRVQGDAAEATLEGRLRRGRRRLPAGGVAVEPAARLAAVSLRAELVPGALCLDLDVEAAAEEDR